MFDLWDHALHGREETLSAGTSPAKFVLISTKEHNSRTAAPEPLGGRVKAGLKLTVHASPGIKRVCSGTAV